MTAGHVWASRVWALGVFGFRSNLRLWLTRAGSGAGAGILLLGPVVSLMTGRGWIVDSTLAFYGLVIALLFGLRSGLALQRGGDLDLFLVHNLVPRVVHAAGMVVSLLLTWLATLGGTFGALTLVSGGDLGLAAWHTTAWGLRSAVPLGFVVIAERVSTLRLPLVLPVFAYVLTVVAATVLIGEEQALELFVMTDRADPGTLVPLARQAMVLTAVTFGGFLAAAALQDRRGRRRRGDRGGRRREFVPSGHGGAPDMG